jgi:hypothetical protein
MMDLVATAEDFPSMNEVWKTEAARFAEIEVPAYVVAGHPRSASLTADHGRLANLCSWRTSATNNEDGDEYDEAAWCGVGDGNPRGCAR